MLLNPITYHAPETVMEAAKLYAALEEAKILAGGTFILNTLKALKRRGTKTPKHVISLKKISGLKGIHIEGDRLIIKSMTTITDLFNCPFLTDNFSVLRTVCRNISTTPIRNMATVGGNLTCRYTWTELGAVLIALEANLHLMGSDGQEEVVSAEDFFTGGAKTNNRILTHVCVKRDKMATLSYQRVKKLSDVDVPMLAVCMRTHFEGNRFTKTRVTVNSWTTFARRDFILEKFLDQSTCDNGVAATALNYLDTSIYDTRSDDYKKAMFRVSIKNAVLELIERRKR